MKTPRQTKRKARRGFTLLEVLLVIVILGVIAAMVVPQLMGRQKKANRDLTRVSIQGLETALKLYAADHYGEYPEGSQEVLAQLLEPEERTDGQITEQYLDKRPLDAWNEMLYYEYPNNKAQGPTTKPAIWSSGPNRQDDQGSGDDINNWSELESSQ